MFPRARAVMLAHYQEVARFVGLDPFQLLAQARLTPVQLNDPENWLPASKALDLIDSSAFQSGRDDFGVLLGMTRTFTSLGPVSLLMKHEASIRDILLAALEYKHLLNDLVAIDMRDDGQNTVVEWNLTPGLRSSQGIHLLSAITYKAVSEAVESAWEPECIHFRHEVPHWVATFRHYFRCPLEFDSHFDGMSCKSAKLHKPNPFADANLARHARRLLNLLPGVREETISDRIRSVIPLLIEAGNATAERVAHCLGMSPRTMQRRLVGEGSSFSRLLRETRRDLAARYMMSSSHDLTTIANLAGYSSLAAFSRWFSEEFGMPPRNWRSHNKQRAFLRPTPASRQADCG